MLVPSYGYKQFISQNCITETTILQRNNFTKPKLLQVFKKFKSQNFTHNGSSLSTDSKINSLTAENQFLLFCQNQRT